MSTPRVHTVYPDGTGGRLVCRSDWMPTTLVSANPEHATCARCRSRLTASPQLRNACLAAWRDAGSPPAPSPWTGGGAA